MDIWTQFDIVEFIYHKTLRQLTFPGTQADDDTYKIIMQDKERLLDIENPLRFIFSHSALREGWDNPNVFQICTLNETKSDIKKRQEIGRGLRLSVNQEGIRSYGRNINRLTVVANEAYEDFAMTLQTEIEEDCGVSFEGKIEEILINPQLFLDLAISVIRKTLNDLMVTGIKYEKIGSSQYEMRLFEENEIETYLDSITFKVNNTSKTIYENYIPLDSNIEMQFAKDCETSEQVGFYFKLPFWFRIRTPIRTYNPDLAVVMKDAKKIYFVAETNSI